MSGRLLSSRGHGENTMYEIIARNIITPLIIQLQDIKVFRFYRDLINFHGRGSPSLMLRCINPAEVSYIILRDSSHHFNVYFTCSQYIAWCYLKTLLCFLQSQLLDQASGTFVRFRLGGVCTPCPLNSVSVCIPLPPSPFRSNFPPTSTTRSSPSSL